MRAVCSLCLTVVLVAGCGPSTTAVLHLKRANETALLSELKKIQVAYNVAHAEFGEYATLAGLSEAAILDGALFAAWNESPDAKPIRGYYFSEIETGPDGDPLDREDNAGVCAYPADPGITGDNIICLTVEPGGRRPRGAGPAVFAALPPIWNFYVARYSSIGEPVTDWPNQGELADLFRVFRQFSSKQGKREIQQLLDSVAHR